MKALLWTLAALLVGSAEAATVTRFQHVTAGRALEIEVSVEGNALVGRVLGGTGNAWTFSVDARGPSFTDARDDDCTVSMFAAAGFIDHDADLRIDTERGESARIYGTATWGAPAGSPAAALFALEVGAGTVRLLWLRNAPEIAGLGRPSAAPALLERGRGRNPLLLLAGGWPANPESDAASARGTLLMLDATTGEALDPPFSTNAALTSGITAIDRDADGVTDRLYVADARFRLWRLARVSPEDSALPRFEATLLAELSEGADPRSALLHAPDVALAGSGGHRWLEVTVGTSDRPGDAATHHWMASVRDTLLASDAPSPATPADLRDPARGWLLALPGPLVGAPLTIAGRRLVATRRPGLLPCAADTIAVVVTTVRPLPSEAEAPPAREAFEYTHVEVQVPADAQLSLEWARDAVSGQPEARCLLGDEALTDCPIASGFRRDFWSRSDAP